MSDKDRRDVIYLMFKALPKRQIAVIPDIPGLLFASALIFFTWGSWLDVPVWVRDILAGIILMIGIALFVPAVRKRLQVSASWLRIVLAFCVISSGLSYFLFAR
jgi:predicted tellurium resistance membrane protein TerC